MSRAIDHDVARRVRRASSELEFLGEPNLPSAESINDRIAAMRFELEDAHRSIHTMLAIARLPLADLE